MASGRAHSTANGRECRAASVDIEITETTPFARLSLLGAALVEVRALGVRLALDDFGTGYSSLTHIKQFPIDVIKIDKSFIDDLNNDADDAAIVTAMITLGRAMGMDVIAEGVESAAQLDALADSGCHSFQGHLVSPALPADEFLAMAIRPNCSSTAVRSKVTAEVRMA